MKSNNHTYHRHSIPHLPGKSMTHLCASKTRVKNGLPAVEKETRLAFSGDKA
jgi:hypothetical protein